MAARIVSGKGRRLVYSTGPGGPSSGRTGCARCNADPCRCEPVASVPPASQAVRVRWERGGRKGKTVTVAGPFQLVRDDAARLLKDLKKKCGAGGALKVGSTQDGAPAFVLEIQGDVVDRVVDVLVAAGYPAKRSGG